MAEQDHSPQVSADTVRSQSFVLAACYASLAVTLLWWALAFVPLPMPEPWLYELRSVCFGTLPNGLPDTWGWMLLLLSPISIFGFLLAVWSDDILPSLRQSLKRTMGRVALVLAVASAIGTFGYVGYRVVTVKLAQQAGSEMSLTGPLPDNYPRITKPAHDFTLTDQYGAPVTLASYRGSSVILTFAYAHCATICPTIIHGARQGAREAQLRSTVPIQLIFITLDPWRDTISALPGLAKAWELDADPRAHIVSGPVELVQQALTAYDIPTSRDTKSGEISHPAIVYIIGPTGNIEYALSNPTPAWIAEAVQRVSQ